MHAVRSRTMLAVAAWSLAGQALAAPTAVQAPGIVPDAAGRLPGAVLGQAASQAAPRSNVLVTKPWNSALQAAAADTFSKSTNGRTFIGMFEAPDDVDAVALVFANAGSAAWSVAEASVSPSSGYGQSTYGLQGVTAFDASGATLAAGLPVTFNGGGAYQPPYPPAMRQWNGTPSAFNTAVLSLPLGTVPANSQAVVGFATTTTSPAYGSAQPTVGSFVSDGSACIPVGAKISSITGTSITLTTNITASANCTVGENVYFTPAQPVLTAAVPAASNPPARSLVFSDWLSVATLPRIDGGMVPGMAMAITGAAANTTAGVVGPAAVALSSPTTGAVAAGATVTFSMTTQAAQASATGGHSIALASTTGLRRGQAVTDATNTGAIPAGTTITYVGSGAIRVSAYLTGTIAAGDSIVASQIAYTSNTATLAAGQTALPFVSTSSRPLLNIRMLTATGSAPWAYYQTQSLIAAEQSQGLADFARLYVGPANTDSVSISQNVGNNFNAQIGAYSPVYAILWHTRHAGVVVMMVGDSHLEGYTTATNADNFVRRAAAALGTATTPVTVLNEAFSGQNANIFNPDALAWLPIKPGVGVLQYSTNNGGDTPLGYASGMVRLADAIQAYGGRSILVSDLPRQARTALTWHTSAAVAAGTTVPLDGFQTVIPPSGSVNYALTGPSVPAGTLVNVPNQPGATLTATAPVTIPTGALVSIGKLTVTSATSNSTAVTFTTAIPYTPVQGITIAGCAATSIALSSLGSLSGTLNTPCSLAAGATALINNGNAVPSPATETALAQLLGLAGGGQLVFDAYTPLEDPADPTYFLPGTSQDGIHANDAGHLLLLNGFLPLLRSVVGQ